MYIAECRALAITEDGNTLIEIPSAGPNDMELRSTLDWDWVERGGGYKAVCERLRERGWIVFCRLDDDAPRFMIVRFKP
jgi:hypothetical protein